MAEFKLHEAFTRADLLLLLYKNILNNNISLSLDLNKPVSYVKIKQNLNIFLQPDHHITENELIIIHTGWDDILSFLFILAIGLGINEKTQEEVNDIITDHTNTILSPSSDGILAETMNRNRHMINKKYT